jgi:hypothetical protein
MEADRYITPEYESGHDISWFAADVSGEIAHFTTGGQGLIPTAVKRSLNALTGIEAYFDNVVIDPKLESEAIKPILYFQRYEMIGIYSYDCDLEVMPRYYYRIALPTQPIKITSIPLEIRHLVTRVTLDLRFSEKACIQEKEIEQDR